MSSSRYRHLRHIATQVIPFQWYMTLLYCYMDKQNLQVRIMRKLCPKYLFCACEKAHEHWVIVTENSIIQYRLRNSN